MPDRPARWIAGLALLAALAPLGCRHWLPPARLPECPGPLVETEAIPGPFLWRQRFRVRAGRVDESLELAVQRRAQSLVVVGFDRLGAKVLTLVQRGREVEAWGRGHLRVPPRNLLYDLHRLHFLALDAPPGGSGEVEGRRQGLRIRERWRAGARVSRALQQEDRASDPGLRIDFQPRGAASIRNDRCGYRVEVGERSRGPS